MLGSSSTTRIFSFSAIGRIFLGTKLVRSYKSLSKSFDIDWKQERERTPASEHAINPHFSAMGLNQAFCNRQSQSHAGRRWIDAHEFFKNFLMKFGGDSTTCIGNRD